jgi:hypothetical protein
MGRLLLKGKLMSKKQKVDDEENQALAAQVNKRKEREEGIPRRSKKPRVPAQKELDFRGSQLL